MGNSQRPAWQCDDAGLWPGLWLLSGVGRALVLRERRLTEAVVRGEDMPLVRAGRF